MRKMATVREIKAIEPIPGADAIEKAVVDGWELVVKKGEFAPGQRCVYCEIDSKMPEDNPAFEFLAPRRYRIKTVKLRGQVSQGICFPMDLLPPGAYEIGEDVSEILGIVKYEPPVSAQLAGQAKGWFPDFIPKTDQERCQNHTGFIEERWQRRTFYVTEKLDGSSVTLYLNDDVFGVCSRNLDLKINEENADNLFIKTARELDIETSLRKMKEVYGYDLALQGELVGPGIQKNPLKLEKVTIFFYNIWNIDLSLYVDVNTAHDMFDACARQLSWVPIVERIFSLEHTVKELVEMSTGTSHLNPKVKREGLVFRSIAEEYIDRFGWLSFKAISPEYLLKHDE